ncbi:MAG: hypothetical protein IPI62_06150 [Bacteroidetes bacterium]|nr:hypothetical protein [Bacteroidota bacterium]
MLRKLVFVLIILFACSFSSFTTNSVDDRNANITEVVHGFYEQNFNDLIGKVQLLRKEVESGDLSPENLSGLKSLFIECRLFYKRNEAFSVFYFPVSDQNMNGPVVSEVEYEDEPKQMIVKPTGFQVIEGELWSDEIPKSKTELLKQIDHLLLVYSSISRAFLTMNLEERHFFQAIQSEVNRHFSLGIAQFDTPDSQNSLNEIKASLASIKMMIFLIYGNENNAQVQTIADQLDITIQYLEGTTKLEKLNYVECLKACYLPLSTSISSYLKTLPKGSFVQSSALRNDQRSIFDKEGFNAFFYNPRGEDKNYKREVAELGKILFFDPVLSSNNKRACASCHRPEMAFTDQLKTSSGFHAGMFLSRNAPTILNVALQRNYFWDNRSTDLEDQVAHVLLNEKEMKSSYEEVVVKLSQSDEYRKLFHSAFEGSADTVISNISISNAIAEYERKLTSLNSRFDKNVRGELNDFTDEEKLGFQTFMVKGNCGSCHYLPMFSGLVPPNYTKSEFENLGTTLTSDLKKPVLDPDEGRGGRYKTQIFMGGFKTPTLRNVELTAPYMHNGAFNTLEEVVEFYNEGGGAGLGLNVPNQTLSSDKLNLTPEEKKSLIAFMKTLTDTIGSTSAPWNLPVFPESLNLNGRIVGGEY